MLLLAIVSIFAWSSFETVMGESDEALRSRALESNQFAAKYVAKTVTNKLELYFRAVEEMASSSRFQNVLETTLADPEMAELRRQLDDPRLDEATARRAARQAGRHPPAQELQERRCSPCCTTRRSPTCRKLVRHRPERLAAGPRPEARHGRRQLQLGGPIFTADRRTSPRSWRPEPNEHITKTTLCRPFFTARCNERWTVTISTPVVKELDDNEQASSWA